MGLSNGERQNEIASRGAGVTEDARADQVSYSSAQCAPIDDHVHLPLGPPRPQKPALRRSGARRHEQLPVSFEDGDMMVTSHNALGIKVPFNPTVATETVSAALAFAKCGITIRHSELPVLAPLSRLMTA